MALSGGERFNPASMEVRLSFAPWLPMVLDVYTQLIIMGYRIDERDLRRLFESAIIVEAE